MTTRRRFLQLSSVAAAASISTRALAAETAVVSDVPATEKSKHAFQLGLASYSFVSFPLEKVWPMTERIGLKHLCLHPIHLPLDSKPATIADAVAKAKESGLDLYSTGVVYMDKPEDIQRGFEYAKALGVRMIVGRPLPALLPLVNDAVQKYDISIAIHNHGPTDKVFPLPSTAYEAIKTLDRRIGLCIDIGHTMRAGIDPSASAQQCADRLLDVHIKDVSAATANGTTVEIGRGVIDIPKFVRTLDKIGYKGRVSFEFEKDKNDPLPGISESVGYVRGVMTTV